MSKLYPISLHLNHKLCIIVGGGKVALRRATKLLECGARVKVVAPDTTDGFEPLLKANACLTIAKGLYLGPSDLTGAFLVFAATDDPVLNLRVQADANALGLFANVASRGDLSDFIVPSSFNQGDLQVSVSTSGKVPGLSKAIKESLEGDFGPEYMALISLLEEVRQLAISPSNDKTKNRYILSDITANYEAILEDLKAGISSHTLKSQLLGPLERPD